MFLAARTRGLIWLRMGCILVWLAASLGIARLASADVGPVPIVPPGSGIQTLVETPVQMVSEDVRLNLRTPTPADVQLFSIVPPEIPYSLDWLPVVADVVASFTLFNPTGEPVSLAAWFPMAAGLADTGFQGRIEGVQVVVAGESASLNQLELPNPAGESLPSIPWVTFPVSFPPGEEVQIEVRYVLPPQLIPGDERGMSFNYILQSGAGWAGPIGSADLAVRLPYPEASPATIGHMPAGGSIDGQVIRWRWTDLEPSPADDFQIRLLQPALWQELQNRQGLVAVSPQDGQAWLELGKAYRMAIFSKVPAGDADFSAYYLPKAIEAYQKAIELLPAAAEPHVGLAEMNLVPLFTLRTASEADLQPVMDELALAEALELQNPPEAGELSLEMLRYYLEILAQRPQGAPAQVAQNSPTPAPTSAQTARVQPKLAASATPGSPTPHLPTAASPPVVGGRNASNFFAWGAGVLLAGGLLLLLAAYLLYRRSR